MTTEVPTLREMKKLLVEQALVRCGGNKTHAAKMIGVSRRTMGYYIRDFGLVQFIDAPSKSIYDRWQERVEPEDEPRG